MTFSFQAKIHTTALIAPAFILVTHFHHRNANVTKRLQRSLLMRFRLTVNIIKNKRTSCPAIYVTKTVALLSSGTKALNVQDNQHDPSNRFFL